MLIQNRHLISANKSFAQWSGWRGSKTLFHIKFTSKTYRTRDKLSHDSTVNNNKNLK